MIENLQQMPQHQRIEILRDNADLIEESSYMKPLTSDDLDAKREVLADNSIKLSEFQDDLKEVKDDFKFKMNPLVNNNKKLLKEIKSRQEETIGKLYHVANHESGFMETYDEDGALIATRKLRPNEKQKTIFQISKAS